MGGIAHLSLDIDRHHLISNDMAKPDRMIFDLAEGQKAKLEELRSRGGYRSAAELLRALVDAAHDDLARGRSPTTKPEDATVDDAAAVMRGRDALQPVTGTLTKSGDQPAIQIGPKAYKPGDLAKKGKGK